MEASEPPRRPVVRALRFVALVVAALALVGCTSGSETEVSVVAERGDAGGTVRLTDVAAQVGLDFEHGAFHWDVSADPPAMLGSGLCWLDYDDDGWLDLFVVNGFAQAERTEWEAEGGLPTSRLFHNVEGRFTDVTDESGAGLALRGQGCVATDFDGDGDTDLFMTGAERGALLLNDGDGRFAERSEEAGVEAFGWNTGAAAGDLNGDGRTDLVVSGYVDQANRIPEATLGFPNTYLGTRDLLYLNEGEGDGGTVTFREVGREAGLEVARFSYGLGLVLADFERDGDLDVYVANDTNPNRLYENVPWPGGAAADPAGLGFRFEERAAAAGVADPASGMGIAAGDYSGDGRTDLFVSNSRGQVHAAYRSNPPDENDPTFADVRSELGPDLGNSTGWGVSWVDLDLDTDLDLVLANGDVPVTDLAKNAEPIAVYLNDAGRFEQEDVAGSEPLLARGSAAADFDNDGDLDVAVQTVGGALVLLGNTGAAGNSLTVALEGSPPGAEVSAVLSDGRTLRRELVAGSSYLSSEDPRLNFGLGEAEGVRELVIRWPGGGETRLEDVPENRIVKVDAP